MPPKRALTFEQFKAAEEVRQTHAGFAVPNPINQPHAAAVWSAEALRRFNATLSNTASNATTELPAAFGHNDIAAAAVADVDVKAVVQGMSLWSPGPETNIVTKFAPQDEFIASMQVLESLLMLHFYDPSEPVISKTLRKMKVNIEQYRSMGFLANEAGKYPSINFLYEVFCFRRLVSNWSILSEQNRQESLNTAIMLFRQFDSAEHQTVGDLIGKSIAEGLRDPAGLLSSLDAACQHTQLAFKKNLSIIRAVHGPYTKDPTATIMYNRSEKEKGGPGNKSSREEAVEVQDELENVDTTDDDEGAAAGGGGDDDGDERVLVKDFISAAMKAEQPVAKKARLDLVNAMTTTSAAQPSRVLVKTASATTTAPSSASASTHRFPCRSKYHAKYSTADKHASAECSFCCVCHMMEFLFNGCGRDCVWVHKPTPRKISVHLKSFPTVFQSAKKRLDDMAVGAAAGPLDIPL